MAQTASPGERCYLALVERSDTLDHCPLRSCISRYRPQRLAVTTDEGVLRRYFLPAYHVRKVGKVGRNEFHRNRVERIFLHCRCATGCKKGKVYPQKEPRTLVRIVGQAPLAATVYELDRLRCNLCGEVFTAPEPEGIGPEKHDETTAAMIALLKYGSRMPFYRLEKLEHLLGIPLAASTQWEIVEEAAEVIQAARDELIRQAAQGEVLHNDDTSMRLLHLARELR